jgi:hypothetical protein
MPSIPGISRIWAMLTEESFFKIDKHRQRVKATTVVYSPYSKL